MGAQAGSHRLARNLRVFHARADGAGIRADVDALRFFVTQSFKSINATDKLPIVGLMLGDVTGIGAEIAAKMLATQDPKAIARTVLICEASILDRKSTRLNSSHQIISYAVFCLKKKKN